MFLKGRPVWWGEISTPADSVPELRDRNEKWDWAFRNHVTLPPLERNKQSRGRRQQTEVCVWTNEETTTFLNRLTGASADRALPPPQRHLLPRRHHDITNQGNHYKRLRSEAGCFFTNSGNHFPLASENQSSPGRRSVYVAVYVAVSSPTGPSSAVPSHRLRVS